MYIRCNVMNFTIMSSTSQPPYTLLMLYFAPSNVKLCTSELFKFHSSQPYIHVCLQKVECTLSKVSLSQMLKSLITLLLL